LDYSDCVYVLGYFTDFKKTLSGPRRFPNGDQLVGPGILAAEELSLLKVGVELQWGFGHAGIEGSLMADQAAKRGVKHFVGRQRWKLMIECRYNTRCPEQKRYTIFSPSVTCYYSI
jgi:hypothetical protein